MIFTTLKSITFLIYRKFNNINFVDNTKKMIKVFNINLQIVMIKLIFCYLTQLTTCQYLHIFFHIVR